ncbi:MAG: hypothetical protein KC478_17205 [Bacteriovoracaceae bacterium]|nr:hypothetical protein [Bacteriovoracaceae bacterium]
MLIRLRKNAKLEDRKKKLLVFADFDSELVDRLFDYDESFWDATLCFVDDLRKVKWELDNGMFDYLYTPLEKTGLVDKRLFRFL